MQEPMVFGTIPGKINSSSAPQGGAPFDYSNEQTRPAPTVQTTTIIADGNTTEFPTPTPTEDSTVLVTYSYQHSTLIPNQYGSGSPRVFWW